MPGEIYSEELEREKLFSDVRLGLDVRQFLASNPIGVYLMDRASTEILQARTNLETVDPDSPQFKEAQLSALAARHVINWLGEAIQAGNNAEVQLTETERETTDE